MYYVNAKYKFNEKNKRKSYKKIRTIALKAINERVICRSDDIMEPLIIEN